MAAVDKASAAEAPQPFLNSKIVYLVSDPLPIFHHEFEELNAPRVTRGIGNGMKLIVGESILIVPIPGKLERFPDLVCFLGGSQLTGYSWHEG